MQETAQFVWNQSGELNLGTGFTSIEKMICDAPEAMPLRSKLKFYRNKVQVLQRQAHLSTSASGSRLAVAPAPKPRQATLVPRPAPQPPQPPRPRMLLLQPRPPEPEPSPPPAEQRLPAPHNFCRRPLRSCLCLKFVRLAVCVAAATTCFSVLFQGRHLLLSFLTN